ncbi:ABC transporter permease subunit [Streptomyces blattellae]|uniref:ABC transporter permease subunit n=1 Tax=Streptomyces blattellae TaxID=2569855 RepID=UPI0012B6DF54|nr:ATP-binding cassette domain-containing protein [Streptomyces blattellae]
MLSVILSGAVTGLLYALAGQGLVVVYRTTRVLNFALGGMGVIVGYVAYDMLKGGVPYWVVLPAAAGVGALLGGLVERLLVVPLSKQPAFTISIATMGVFLGLEGAASLIWGLQPRSLPPVLADAGTVRFGSTLSVSANQLFIIGTAVVMTAVLLVLVERSRLGLGMRATSSGPMTAQLLGVDVKRVRLAGWLIGGAYGSAAALLVTPLTYLSPTSFATFLLTAVAAVILGGFTNIVGVVLGAIAFGVGTNLLVVYPGGELVSTYTFLAVALILVFRPHGLFGRAERELDEPDLGAGAARRGRRSGVARRGFPSLRPAPWMRAVPWAGWAAVAVLLAMVPYVLPVTDMYTVATVLAAFVAVVGLNIVAGHGGQVSLGTGGFAAAGGYGAAIAVEEGVPLILALVVAGVAAAVLGLVIGIAVIRLSGLYLALLTLLFAFATPELLLYFRDVTGGDRGKTLASEAFLTPESQYWLVYVVAAAVALFAGWAGSSRLGRNWRAVRDSENGARALGLNTVRVKLGAFVLSSGLIGLSGALTGVLIAFVAPDSYDVFFGVYVLLAVVLGGSGSVAGSLAGAAFITLVPEYSTGLPAPLVFGAALLVVMLVAPSGLAGIARRLVSAPREVDVVDANGTEDAVTDGVSDSVAVAEPPIDGVEHPALEQPALLRLHQVSAGYGDGRVLKDFSLTVGRGEVVSLLGANGAGKSTVLRVISGLIPCERGEISWSGTLIGSRNLDSPHLIARAGIAHVPEGRGVFPDLTVQDNLRMGMFFRPREQQGGLDDALEEVFEHFPVLKSRLRQLSGSLSGGEQQMLAIGRALVGSPRLLMLDEPSLGLSPLITQQIMRGLRSIADQQDVSVLLIEQNARAALELSDRAYVLARGRVATTGSAQSLLVDHELSHLYLGVDA